MRRSSRCWPTRHMRRRYRPPVCGRCCAGPRKPISLSRPLQPSPTGWWSLIRRSLNSWLKRLAPPKAPGASPSPNPSPLANWKSSVCWRMPASQNPSAPRRHQMCVVELESNDRGAPLRSSSDNQNTVRTPAKVLSPGLKSRIEERHFRAAFGVYTGCLRALGAITQGAGKPEIVFRGRPTHGQRNDVLYMHRHGCVRLGSTAVATAIVGSRGNFAAQCLRNADTRHALYPTLSCMGTRYPRRARSRYA